MIVIYHGWNNDTREWIQGVDFEDCVVGKIHGILFKKRGWDDNHVCMWNMIEDDETWHIGQLSGSTSSAWIEDIIDVAQRAQQWLLANCDPDPTGYGYITRS